MPDYDKLEQLNRLRESGALTKEEFHREKVKLLNDEPRGGRGGSRAVMIVTGILVVLAIAVLIGSGILSSRDETSEATTNTSSPALLNESEATTAQAIEEPLVAEVANTIPTPTLDWAFSEEVIGLNPSFVEGKLGPAKSKSKTQWEFDVKGCNVSYAVSGSEIASASTFVKTGCLPKVGHRTITPQTTFAQLRGDNDIIRSSCIYNCGNAYDPTIDLYQHGYHANGFIEVVYQSNFGDAQDKGRELWRKAIRVAHRLNAEGYEGDDYEWYQCVASPPASVVAAIGPENVGYVTMGRNLTRDGSCRFPA